MIGGLAAPLCLSRSASEPDLYHQRPGGFAFLLSERLGSRSLSSEASRLHFSTIGASRSQIFIIRGRAASMSYYRDVSEPDLYHQRHGGFTLPLSGRLRARSLLLEVGRLHVSTVGAPRSQICMIGGLTALLFYCRSASEQNLHY